MKSLYCVILCGLLAAVNAFTISLVEGEKTGVEGGTVNITAQLLGQNRGEVEISIKACTVSEFQEQNLGTLPLSIANDPAETSDFSIATTSHTFSPAPPGVLILRMDHIIVVQLEDDNINEQEETFIVAISVTRIDHPDDENEDLFSRNHTIIKIIDPDATTFSVQSEPSGSNSVNESTGEWFITLTVTENPPENIFQLELETTGVGRHQATPDTDFVAPSGINMSCNATLPCYTQIRIEIRDDGIPEPELEGLQVTFSELSEYGINFNPTSISIQIMDDDVITYGFVNTEELKIREGQSAEVVIGILSPSIVEVSIQFNIRLHRGENASSGVLIEKTQNILLGPDQRQQTITIETTDDNIIGPNENFQLEIEGLSQRLQKIDPAYLDVQILDNDTNISFGIKGESPLIVQEGDNITVTVTFLEVDLSKVDEDFVVDFAVKIRANEDPIQGNFEDTVLRGKLSQQSRNLQLSFRTKNNNEPEANRMFAITVEKASVGSPLVRVSDKNSTITVIIVDNDIGPPNQPKIVRDPTVATDGVVFEVEWEIETSAKNPVDSYVIIVTGVHENGSIGDTMTYPVSNPNTLSSNVSFEINKFTYLQVLLEVCAVNSYSQSCSEKASYTLTDPTPESVAPGEESGNNISKGGAAAIGIIAALVLLCLIGLVLIIVVLFLNKWKNYFPEGTEKEKEKALESATPPPPQPTTDV